MERNTTFLWNRFTLREALLLGFCATFIVITRAALRMKLNLPGHSMFFMMFFLVLARGCVPKLGASTLVGLIAGAVSFMLGMGKNGPLIMANFVLPALFVDAAAFLYPALPARLMPCIIAGALASATKAITGVVLDILMGIEEAIIVQHIIITTAFSSLFGAAGAALVPSVVRRLRANRLIPGPGDSNR
jgi:hypothetical protein